MATGKPIRQERLRQVREWKASGLTTAEFAEREGLKPRTLTWWAWKLKSEGESLTERCCAKGRNEQAGPALEFVEIEPVTGPTTDPASPMGSPGLELKIRDVTVCVPDHFKSTTLERVLDVLETRR